jgi:hypothetical protein
VWFSRLGLAAAAEVVVAMAAAGMVAGDTVAAEAVFTAVEEAAAFMAVEGAFIAEAQVSTAAAVAFTAV